MIPRPKDEEKKPGDDPEAPKPPKAPEAPGDKPGDGKPKPIPIPMDRMMQIAKPMPEHVKKMFEARKGYANYYFNRSNRDRVWQACVGETDFSAVAGTWKIQGAFAEGGAVELTLAEEDVSGVFDGVEAKVDPASDLSDQQAPDGSGGLLVALHLWQRLLTKGPEKFGQVYYLGTAPLLGSDKIVDVLVATHDVVESHFMFDPQTGRLTAMELFTDPDEDPCEVLFEDYREVGGYPLPHRLKILHGDDAFGIIDFRQIELPQKAEDKT
jgi:hypothetical protein